MNNKTLYISDLDGTLLRKDQRLSPYAIENMNKLIKNGMLFSYATARSYATASKVTSGLKTTLPAILNNGTFLFDMNTQKAILSNSFTSEEKSTIYNTLRKYDINPIVYSIINGKEKNSYIDANINKPTREFIDSRKGDGRANPLTDTDDILAGDVFYFTSIGDEEKLEKAYAELKDSFNCMYQIDIYSKERWFEVLSKKATKANAINQLKELLGCDKVVVFGDGMNDIPMFESADECYAVANAVDELKAISTGIIESNENDGVVKYLIKDIELNFNR